MSHEVARGWVFAVTQALPSWRRDLLRYIDQQEQSEREAAGLREQLANSRALNEALGEEWRKEGLIAQLAALRAENEGLKKERDEALRREADAWVNDHPITNAEMLRRAREQVAFCEAVESEPAEAAPVLSYEEALDAMGEEIERHPIGGHGDGRGRAAEAAPVAGGDGGMAWQAAVNARSSWAQRHEAAPALKDYCGYCNKLSCICGSRGDISERAQEAAEQVVAAAQVRLAAEAPAAKGRGSECPHGVGLCTSSCPSKASVAKAEAPSEPAGWVPAKGDVVRFKRGHPNCKPENWGKLAVLVRVEPCAVMYGGDRWATDLDMLEPAPQPPATTGEAAANVGTRAAEARARIELEALAEKPAQAEQKESCESNLTPSSPSLSNAASVSGVTAGSASPGSTSSASASAETPTELGSNPAGEREDFVSGLLRWHGGADLTICLVPWHRVQEPNGPQAATAEDLEEFGWVPKPADPTPPQLGLEARLLDSLRSFASSEDTTLGPELKNFSRWLADRIERRK